MACIRKEMVIEARPESIWEAIRDVGAVHRRLTPGFVVDCRLDGDARIVTFAKLVGRENVIAGTDCGFAQAQDIQRVHPQVMWAKFESLAEGARLASKQLWQ